MRNYLYPILVVGAMLFVGASCVPQNPVPVENSNQDQATETSTTQDTVTTPTQPQADCNTATDCGTNSQSWVCNNGVCELNTVRPPDSQICSNNNNSWFCDRDQWCGEQSGTCRDLPYCTTSNHCDSGVCTGGYCLGGSNTVRPEHSPCNSNAQCISGKVCVNGGCVPLEETVSGAIPCNSNAQCVSGKLCQNSVCVPAEQVLPSDPGTGELLCNNNEQCWNGKICVNSHCVLPTDPKASCTTDAQCGGKGWSCTNGKCVAWSTPPALLECSAFGQTWTCGNDAKCGSKINDCLYGIGCTSNTQCSANQYCGNGTCKNKYQFTGTSCTTYADCGDIDNYVCVDNKCARSSAGTKRCENSTYVWYCDNENYTCGNTPSECNAQVTCSSDSQCRSGFVCFQGRCAQPPNTCNFHTECLSDNVICQDGYCVWPGNTNHTCSNEYGERWMCTNSRDCGLREGQCREQNCSQQKWDEQGNCLTQGTGGLICGNIQGDWLCGFNQTCGSIYGECLN